MTNFEAAMIMDGEWEMTSLEPSHKNFIAAAQHLADTGLAWQLQGRVGRIVADLIERDLVILPS